MVLSSSGSALNPFLSPMFFDSHVHFEQAEGADGIAALLERAQAAGVSGMLAVGANPQLNELAAEAARRYPAAIRAAIGLDRDQAAAGGDVPAACDGLRREIDRLRSEGVGLVALGEIGLDFHYHPETARSQVALFRAQLQLAGELDLPVIVHSREADAETLAGLSAYAAARRGCRRLGVLHCFTGDEVFAARLVALGFCISFSGIVTFRNASPLRATSSAVPEDHLLIETDTPWLTPVPYRGRRNEPAYVVRVAECLAAVRGCSVEHLAETTSRNALRLLEGAD